MSLKRNKHSSDDDDNKSAFKLKTFSIQSAERQNFSLYKPTMSEYIEDMQLNDIKTNRMSECNEEIKGFDPATSELWLMQCAKGTDIESLIDKRLKIPGRRYVGDMQVRTNNYPTSYNQTVGFVNKKGKYDVRNLPVVGKIVVSKRLNMNMPSNNDLEANVPPSVPNMPSKVRLPVRHPFFGCQYKQHTDLNQKISSSLHLAQHNYDKFSSMIHDKVDFYQIRKKMLETTETLQQKELQVRKSVLTGITPGFMKESLHPNYDTLFDNGIDGSGKHGTKRKAADNDDIDNATDKDTSRIKNKKKKLLTDSGTTINLTQDAKEEDGVMLINDDNSNTETKSKKKKNRLANVDNEINLTQGEILVQTIKVEIDDIKVEIPDDDADDRRMSKKAKKSLYNGNKETDLTMEDIYIKLEPPDVDDEAAQISKKKKKRHQNGHNDSALSEMRDEVAMSIKIEEDDIKLETPGSDYSPKKTSKKKKNRLEQ